MMRRLAAAVVLGLVNLAGAAGSEAGFCDLDDDGIPDGAECVEYRRSHDEGSGQSEGGVLAAAANACGEPIDAAWVLRERVHHRRAAAAVSVYQRADGVAVLDLACEPARDGWENLVARALAFCRDRGALKLVVEYDHSVRLHQIRAAVEWAQGNDDIHAMIQLHPLPLSPVWRRITIKPNF